VTRRRKRDGESYGRRGGEGKGQDTLGAGTGHLNIKRLQKGEAKSKRGREGKLGFFWGGGERNLRSQDKFGSRKRAAGSKVTKGGTRRGGRLANR